jgi:hypothetical protein
METDEIANSLIDAVRNKKFLLLKHILQRYPDKVNSADISGKTLLIISVENRDVNSTAFLLSKRRANQQIRDDNNKTALDYAIENKDFDNFRLLVNDLSVPEIGKLLSREKNPTVRRLLQYEPKPILSRLDVKRLIKILLAKEFFQISKKEFVYLKSEFGEETVVRFMKFLIEYCELDKFFPKSIYLTRGVYGYAFRLCLTDDCAPPIVLKAIPYLRGSCEPHLTVLNPRRPENIEWEILSRLNRIFATERYYSVPIAYNSFICKANFQIRQFLQRFINVDDKIKDYRMTFMEYVDRGTLKDFVVENPRYSKPLIFQVIYAMALVLEKVPGFRHNDFHMDNLLLRTQKEFYCVNYGNIRFTIPSPKVLVLLNDFDFSFVKDESTNAKYQCLFPDLKDPTPYHDMFKFFNHLLVVVEGLPEDVKKFAKYVVPEQLIGHTVEGKVGFYNLKLTEEVLLTKYNFNAKTRYPSELLKHDIFSEFITF